MEGVFIHYIWSFNQAWWHLGECGGMQIPLSSTLRKLLPFIVNLTQLLQFVNQPQGNRLGEANWCINVLYDRGAFATAKEPTSAQRYSQKEVPAECKETMFFTHTHTHTALTCSWHWSVQKQNDSFSIQKIALGFKR